MRLADGPLLELASVVSTQDVARDALERGDRLVGVRADFQSGGRGRRGARWDASPEANLLVTYIVCDVAPVSVPRLGMTSAIAVCQALEALIDVSGAVPLHPAVKWPNDVLLSRRKVAGVLVEASAATRSALVGVGLNVNVVDLPAGIAARSTSLRAETGREWDIGVVERRIRAAMAVACAMSWEDVLRAWRDRDATVGLRYVADVSGVTVEGVATGIADGGALLLTAADGTVWEVRAASSVR